MKARKETLKEILEKAHTHGYELPLRGSEIIMIYTAKDPVAPRVFIEKRDKVLVLSEWSIANPRKYLGWIYPEQLLKLDLPSDMAYHLVWRTDVMEELP